MHSPDDRGHRRAAAAAAGLAGDPAGVSPRVHHAGGGRQPAAVRHVQPGAGLGGRPGGGAGEPAAAAALAGGGPAVPGPAGARAGGRAGAPARRTRWRTWRRRRPTACTPTRRAPALGVFVADCVPVLLADPRTGACAAVHAGWRGVVAGVVTSAVQALAQAYGTRAGDCGWRWGRRSARCCFEVGPEVVAAFRRGPGARWRGRRGAGAPGGQAAHRSAPGADAGAGGPGVTGGTDRSRRRVHPVRSGGALLFLPAGQHADGATPGRHRPALTAGTQTALTLTLSRLRRARANTHWGLGTRYGCLAEDSVTWKWSS